MKRYRINEIFISIQGEGPRVGHPAVFIRFSGCNTQCSFCDTDYDTWESMTTDEIVEAARNVAVEAVPVIGGHFKLDCILTGGEPLLQLDKELVGKLAAKYSLNLETNCSSMLTLVDADRKRIAEVLNGPYLMEIVISPKGDGDFSSLIAKLATCVKVVYPLPFPDEQLAGLVASAGDGGFRSVDYILQPLTPPSGINSWEWRSACSEAVSFAFKRLRHYGETWRVVPQTHVMMGIQ